MDPLLSLYQNRLDLQDAQFTRVDHEDAMVAVVYRFTHSDGTESILKICSRSGDYFREVYFLHHFAHKLPVPRILQLVPPSAGVHGAILMECFSGQLLQIMDLTERLSYEIGSFLGQIHLQRVKGYGDLTQPAGLTMDPRIPFTSKFEEGLAECKDHLPTALLQKCRREYDRQIDLLREADGPCIVHRDFRPGNILVEKGQLQGIIDWSSARGGFAEEDFCPLEFGEWSDSPASKSAFLSGYANVRKVPEYARLMPLLRLSRAIGAIGFTVKRGTWTSKGAKIYQFNRRYIESI